MFIASLQTMLKFVLDIGTTFGLAFMLVYTVFVIVCAIHGDIKINIVKNETENEKK